MGIGAVLIAVVAITLLTITVVSDYRQKSDEGKPPVTSLDEIPESSSGGDIITPSAVPKERIEPSLSSLIEANGAEAVTPKAIERSEYRDKWTDALNLTGAKKLDSIPSAYLGNHEVVAVLVDGKPHDLRGDGKVVTINRDGINFASAPNPLQRVCAAMKGGVPVVLAISAEEVVFILNKLDDPEARLGATIQLTMTGGTTAAVLLLK